MRAVFEKVTYRPQENHMVLLSPPRKSVSGLDISSLTLKKSHCSGVWSLPVTSHPLEKQNEYIDTCAVCSPKHCIHFSVHKTIFTMLVLYIPSKEETFRERVAHAPSAGVATLRCSLADEKHFCF